MKKLQTKTGSLAPQATRFGSMPLRSHEGRGADRRRVRAGLLLASALLALPCASMAATLTWNGAAGDGKWSTTSANWTDGSSTKAWVNDSDAVFTTLVGFTVEGVNKFNTLTIPAIAGTMTTGNSSDDRKYLEGTGDAKVYVPSGTTLSLPAVRGTAGLKLDGGGTLTCNRTYYYSGDTVVLNGTLRGSSAGSLPPSASTIRLLDPAGSGGAVLYVSGWNSNWTISNPITVQSGAGTATIVNDPSTGGPYKPIVSGPITLNGTLRVDISADNLTTNITLSGGISGAGKLQFKGADNNGRAQTLILSGDNTAHTGAIEMLAITGNSTATRLELQGTAGNANITLNSKTQLRAGASGSRILRYKVANDTSDLITLTGTGGAIVFNDLNLEPVLTGTQTLSEYVIVNTTTQVYGTFASIINHDTRRRTFEVDYDGTTLNPGKVVLLVTLVPPSGTVITIR